MWLKRLFTVPEGEKITEKVFGRILVSSICSILICMTCLFGTTWAWFVVDIENTGNVIQIGEPNVKLLIDGTEYNPRSVLPVGGTEILVQRQNEPDDLGVYCTMQVTIKVYDANSTARSNPIETCEVKMGPNCGTAKVTINSGKSIRVVWEVFWITPEPIEYPTEYEINVPSDEPGGGSGTDQPAGDPPAEGPSGDSPVEEPTETPTEEPTTPPAEEPSNDPVPGGDQEGQEPEGETGNNTDPDTEEGDETPSDPEGEAEEETDTEGGNEDPEAVDPVAEP